MGCPPVAPQKMLVRFPRMHKRRAWLWLVWRIGPRRAWRYYREGRKRGWMTEEQAREFFAWYFVETQTDSAATFVYTDREQRGCDERYTNGSP